MTGVRIKLTTPHILTRDGQRVGRLRAGTQMKMLFALMGKHRVSVDDFGDILWPNPDTMPDAWMDTIRVHICMLRRSLRDTGWGIKNSKSWGWSLVASA